MFEGQTTRSVRSTLPKTSEWKAPESDKVPKEKDEGFWAMFLFRFLGICDFVFKDVLMYVLLGEFSTSKLDHIIFGTQCF